MVKKLSVLMTSLIISTLASCSCGSDEAQVGMNTEKILPELFASV